MCARAVDESFDNSDHESPWTGNDVMPSCMTSSGEFPRRRRRGIPAAWRYSLPSSITHSISASIAVQQPADNTLPTAVSISGNDNEAVSGFDRRRRYVATGSRNVAAESGPRIRPTCLRYSYWLTLDDRRHVTSKYSTPTSDKSGGHENQLKRHFRPQSCEIVDRKSPLCGVEWPSYNENDESVFGGHLTCGHVTESTASEQIISTSTSALDVKTDCGDHLSCPAVRQHSDNDRVDYDVTVDGSRDEVKGQGRLLSLSKIGDSGLGASIHSEQTSPEETNASDLNHHHHHHHQQQQQQQQQQQLHQRLCDDDDDVDETNDVSESQGQTQSEGRCEHCGQGQAHGQIDQDDNRTLLTRHKREYLLTLSMVYISMMYQV